MNWTGFCVALRGGVLASLLALSAACDSTGGDSQRAVEGSAVSLETRRADTDTLFLDPAQIVGLINGAPEYLFGSITSVATDAHGRIYVGDGIGASVRVFDHDGTFLAWVALAGGGPGEIHQRPADLIFAADDRLYVRDGTRVTVFFARRAGGLIADSVVATWNTRGLGNTTSSRSGLARDGRYFYPSGHYPPNDLPRFFYISYTDGQLDGDTLQVPPYPGLRGVRPAVFSLGRDGLLLPGLNRVPFSAVPVWHVTPDGTLVSSDGASSLLIETDVTGDTLRTLQLPEGPLRSIPAIERADSLAALERRIAEAEERIARFGGRLSQVVGLGEGVPERRLPDSLPAVIGLSVTQNGSIWVERWPPEDEQDSRYYDVLDPSGRLRSVVVLRAPLVRDPSPWFGERSIAGIIRDPETGVERVARFDLP